MSEALLGQDIILQDDASLPIHGLNMLGSQLDLFSSRHRRDKNRDSATYNRCQIGEDSQ